jgi:hypothetical protein
MFLAEVAPGASTPKHYRPGQEFAHFLAGEGVLYEKGKPPVTLKPGLPINNYSSPEGRFPCVLKTHDGSAGGSS